jgi:hypothetical protein
LSTYFWQCCEEVASWRAASPEGVVSSMG